MQLSTLVHAYFLLANYQALYYHTTVRAGAAVQKNVSRSF